MTKHGAKTRIEQGDHVCALFSRKEEQLALAFEYVRSGLERGERCLYMCGERSVAEFREALKAEGIDVDGEEARGALVLNNARDGYLPQGEFDPDAMIALLAQEIKDALDAGFTGLCAAGDMTWLLDDAPGTNRLAEYEARLNEFYHSHKGRGLCFYDRSALPSSCVDHSLATHKYVYMPGSTLLENVFQEPDHQAMHRQAADLEIVTEKLDILDASRIAKQAGAPLPTSLL